MSSAPLRLYNSHTRALEVFSPINNNHVRLYFCGPTVYDRVHLGNLRAMLCADILVRLLKTRYAEVTYVRNITDIDDKIITRAHDNNEDINALTSRTTIEFHEDLNALNILPPNIEPRATQHISDMLTMIDTLIQQGHAYEAEGHVLFSVQSFKEYGRLSGRSLEDMQAGARVDVAGYKRHPGDFILWKPSSKNEPGWDSPYGRGRPGWHIECSAMAQRYLGNDFDIHGGGNDLLFPHHENERAQSLCCVPHSTFARHWLHVGMLLCGGEKMSKSLGNFHTIHKVIERAPAEALRLLYLGSHYRSTLDFTWEKLDEARRIMDRFYRALEKTPPSKDTDTCAAVINALNDDLNTPQVIAELHILADDAMNGQQNSANALYAAGQLLGLFNMSPSEWFQGDVSLDPTMINQLIEQRLAARKVKDFTTADSIRNQLTEQGILLEDGPQGTTWRKA